MKKLLAVMLLAVVASLGAPQAFADGGIEMPGKTNEAGGISGTGGIEMPGCATQGGVSMQSISVTISIIVSTLI
jgi:hypothetical protein